MLVPLPSDDRTAKSNVPIRPNTAKPPPRPVVAIPIEKHPNIGQSRNSQYTQTRSGRVSKPPERFTS